MVAPWYKEGLRFKCTQCGKCCTGAPGYVWVSDAEIVQMAAKIGLSIDDFCAKYIRIVLGKKSLKEHPVSYDCLFLKDKKCTLYEARPQQCRQFPWWPHNLETKECWDSVAKECEGINHPEAPLITLRDIQEQME